MTDKNCIHIAYNIYTLRKRWKHIVERNPAIMPTQSFEYYCYLFLAFYSRLFKVGRWRMTFHYYKNDKEECIIPLIVNHKRKQIRSVSYYGRLDYDDVISTTNSLEFISEAMGKICQLYPQYRITWKNINEKCIVYTTLKEIAEIQEPCVSIELPTSYEQYYTSLSKHQRQNVRTSYNRLNTDGISFSFQCYDSSKALNKLLWNKCEKLYTLRHNIDHCVMQRLRNPYHHILVKHPQQKIFILASDNNPIAYMAGLYNEQQKIYYVPRLCINDVYKKYSPGIILVNETIKYLINQGTSVLDLMEGDELYKIAMGGVVYNNYQIHKTTEDILHYVYTS